jgi:cell division transport system permease protein
MGQAGQGLARNLTMTVAGVLTVMVALALLSGALIVRSGTNQVKAELLNQLNVSVYLEPNVTPAQQTSIDSALRALPQVESVDYISKTQAYALFREYFSDNPDIIKLTPKSAVPTSFIVKLYNPEQFDVVQSAVGQLPGVQSVTNASSRLDHVFTFLHGITIGALVVAILMMGATALLIYNAMQVSAFSRRRETGIMRLVGASDLSIQLPFVLEGTAIGVVGGLLSFGLLMLTRVWIHDNVALGILSPFGELNRWLGTLPVILAVGIGLSALMSFVTLQRHLRV